MFELLHETKTVVRQQGIICDTSSMMLIKAQTEAYLALWNSKISGSESYYTQSAINDD